MQLSPHKSVFTLAAQSGISIGSCRKALKKNLHMYPYKITVVQELFENYWRSRMQYCQWFNENLDDDNVLDVTFMSDEAWFHFSGYVSPDYGGLPCTVET